ncbi:hypothetical protein ANCDUO_07695 [Ancylostoma duodenale]|uniref:Uncharacterized protein n=1 Tax=Ancylostoma duodenale TaxID=51022 RepID=A0A0C2GXZ1_9BILA|nr:hypothetical protein ANCDUO_07695 [Ancylostoma duodenale]
MFTRFKASFDEYVSKLPVAGQPPAQGALPGTGLPPLAQPQNIPPSPLLGTPPAMPSPKNPPQGEMPRPIPPPASTPPQCYAAHYGDPGQPPGAGKPLRDELQNPPKFGTAEAAAPAAEKQRFVQPLLAHSPGVGSVYIGAYR